MSRWVTFHGIALNIDCDINNFSEIIPCGITDAGISVTSLRQLVSEDINIDKTDVIVALKSSFQDVFGVKLVPKSNAYATLEGIVKTNPLPKDITDNLIKLK